MRSVPEKTFEHWCAMHLSYRYRAHLQMWWPSSTADIDIAGGPLAPGKRIWLELKTTEWNAKQSRHDLSVDLVQLRAYGRNPVPDYYVFPVPPWSDVLGIAGSLPWLGSLDRTAVAYQAQSGDRWFAEWTYVVSGKALRRALASEIAALPAPSPSLKPKRLRVAEVVNGSFAWVPKTLASTGLTSWRDFWIRMEDCGDAGDFSAEFILPTGELEGRRSVSHLDLAAAVRRLRGPRGRRFDYRAFARDQLTAWVAVDGGDYVRESTAGRELADGFAWTPDTGRSLTLLGAGILQPQ